MQLQENQDQVRMFSQEYLETNPEANRKWIVVDEIVKVASGKGFLLIGHSLVDTDRLTIIEEDMEPGVTDFIWNSSPIGKQLVQAARTGENLDCGLMFQLGVGLKKPPINIVNRPGLVGEHVVEDNIMKWVFDWEAPVDTDTKARRTKKS